MVLVSGCVGQPTLIDESASADAVIDTELVESTVALAEEFCGIRFEGLQLPEARFGSQSVNPLHSKSDYLLFKFLGFVAEDFDRYDMFSAAVADQRLGSYDVATETIYLHPRLRGTSTDLARVTLMHELVHSWHLQRYPEVAESLAADLQTEPDRYLTGLAVAEGFAVACMNAWHKLRLDGGTERNDIGEYVFDEFDEAWRLATHAEDFSSLSRFHRRTQQWTYGLGGRYFSEVMDTTEPTALGSMAISELPSSTAELLKYKDLPQCEGRCRSLGALLTREMLIWSGLDWQNSDVVSSSVVEDALEWTDYRAGNTCAHLSIIYRELDDVHPRILGVRDALRRWAAINDHTITFDDVDPADGSRSILVMEHCYTDDAVIEPSAGRNGGMPRYVDSAREASGLATEQPEHDDAILIPDLGGSLVDSLVQAAGRREQREDVKAMLWAMAERPEAFVDELRGEESDWLRADAENALNALDSSDPRSLRPLAPRLDDDPISITVRREWW